MSQHRTPSPLGLKHTWGQHSHTAFMPKLLCICGMHARCQTTDNVGDQARVCVDDRRKCVTGRGGVRLWAGGRGWGRRNGRPEELHTTNCLLRHYIHTTAIDNEKLFCLTSPWSHALSVIRRLSWLLAQETQESPGQAMVGVCNHERCPALARHKHVPLLGYLSQRLSPDMLPAATAAHCPCHVT